MAAGVRLVQREVNRVGAHRDVPLTALPRRLDRVRALVAQIEGKLLGAIGGRGEVRWYQQVRLPSDLWLTSWKPWTPVSNLHTDTVMLRCSAWLDLDEQPVGRQVDEVLTVTLARAGSVPEP